MEEREKYVAEIKARLRKCDETLCDIRTKLKECNEPPPGFEIDPIVEKQERLKARLDEVERKPDNSWARFKSEIDGLTNDIDDDLRKGLAYFS